uniref:Monocarboxylate transporter 5 n=1 Tax=Lygus hesperus TaxID=30085 RepID=A0A146M148_LYGHE
MTGPVVTNTLAKPPDGGWGWVIVFGSFMVHILADGLTYSWGIFQVALVKDFQCGEGPASWIISILVGVTLCSGPLTSALVNRYNCRTVTIAGALLASAGLAVSSLAQNLLTLYISVGLVTGLGLGLMYLPAIVSVTCYFEKYRSMATGIAVCGSGFGMFLMSPLLGFLINRLEWRRTILITGGMMLSCVGFGALFRPLETTVEDVEKGSELKPLEAKTKEEHQLNGQPPQISLNGKTPTSPTSNGTSDGDSPTQNGPKRPHSIHGAQGILDNVATPTISDKARLALSQPQLQQVPEPPRKSAFGSGIMYRKDVLYGGSLANLQHHNRSNSHVDNRKMSHHGSRHHMTHGEEKPLMRNRRKSSRLDDRPRFCGIPCAQETADTLQEMLDCSLFLEPVFILYVISNFFTSIGFNVPYVYIVKLASDRGVDEDSANLLLSVVGLANTFGKAFLGYVADKPWVNRLYMYNISLTVCGLSCIMCIACSTFTTFAIVAAIFGLSCGAYVGLTAVVLVDLLGLDRLTNAFGLLLLFQGFASFIGPPITGGLYDYFQSFNHGFIFSGLMVCISGLMLFAIPSIQRLLERRSAKVGATTDDTTATTPIANSNS